MTEDGQEYEHDKESTEGRQKYEHNKIFEEPCGIKRETITVVSFLFFDLVIHCHRLSLRNCVFSIPPLWEVTNNLQIIWRNIGVEIDK